MIKDQEFYHGAVLARLVVDSANQFSVRVFKPGLASAFVLNETVGLYIKYSTKRMSPWRFTFLREHQDEIAKMRSTLPAMFLVLVCETDGFVVLSFEELKSVLNFEHDESEWISATRRKGHQYTVKGSDGKLDFKVSHTDFLKKILEPISKEKA